ncbi:MAG: pyruvate kinase [Limnochordia bacterium]|jgi:pyruvate kinase|nr:pyruvate kinase [Bacillota bacterium]HOB09365.1 pyruvate kinase [Limnochordia bacterium]NLH31395.1 pyruvate kinase [Bacillota bacterium]HPT93354.1 pyruvate kinase [Limnochordia bacterium]HPZ30461.1 pyruvate kinase [Limnochordia bacterium]
MVRKTKIVCTIGPATESPKMITELIKAGMNVARLNLSHGSSEEHLERIQVIRRCGEELGVNVGILLDIKGPKIRIGELNPDKFEIEAGHELILTTEECTGTAEKIFVNYPYLVEDLNPGDTIYIDDGLIELVVLSKIEKHLICKVIVGGTIGSRKGVTLPGVNIKLPPLTEEDIKHIQLGVEYGVDFIAASFVRQADHVVAIKDLIHRFGGDIPVIAKIESGEGIRNIDAIIQAADGIMVARGDMGVEIPPEEVPLAQKMIIQKCNDQGKPVITATQMLDSMIRNPRATRAEITDVANAILDGTDAVMLSGETAVGRYPIKAVALMNSIALRIERSMDYQARLEARRRNRRQNIADAISLATVQTAHDLGAAAILCSTQSGATARSIAKYRPEALLIAVCHSEAVVNQLMMTWGVNPILAKKPDTLEELIDVAIHSAKEKGLVKEGDIVAITAGVKTGVPGSTNLLQVQQIGADD